VSARPPSPDDVERALGRRIVTAPDLPERFASTAVFDQPRPVVKLVFPRPDGPREAWLEIPPPPAIRDLPGSKIREGTAQEAAAAWGASPTVLASLGTQPTSRVVLVQLPAWRIGWSIGKRRGSFWMHGEDVFFPDPAPRPRVHPAVFLVAGAVAGALVALALPRLPSEAQSARREGGPPLAVRPPPAPPPPVEVEPPPPPPRPAVRPFPDALVLLLDGSLLRGAATAEPESVRVVDWEREVVVERWRIDRIEPDAAISARRHLKALEAWRQDVVMLASTPSPPRERITEKLVEGLRQDDLWTRLKPLCKTGELPAGTDPLGLLDWGRARLEALLQPEPAASPLPPLPPPPRPPADPETAAAFAALGDLLDPERLPGVPPALAAIRGRATPLQSIAELLTLLLARGGRDAGLVCDRFLASGPDLKLDVEAFLDVVSSSYVAAHTAGGDRMSGLLGSDGKWTVRTPGREPLTAAACEARRGVLSSAGQAVLRHLQKLPLEKYLTATPEQHLEAARQLESEAPAALAKSGERAADFLRMLAAAHAGAALEKGGPEAGQTARARLAAMGFAAGFDGVWQRPGEAAAVSAGAMLRIGRADLAPGALRDLGAASNFPAALRAAVVQLRKPATTAEEAAESVRRVQRLAALARTDLEKRHAEALLDSIGKVRTCARCGGDSSSRCTACRGTGRKSTFCGGCNGHGVVIRAGQGGGTFRCGVCLGQRGPTTTGCLSCSGTGRIRCASCPASRPPPAPSEIASMADCPTCLGGGRTPGRVGFGCPVCAGLGVLLIPAADSDAVLR
jgi:hypothetical protein